eukprot:m.177880 g.177880  ORF g.177880 m.177880 type:complete len:299 (+) comp18384_c0_seq1:315-1211(+)
MASGGSAGDALNSIVEQTFDNIHSQTPAFEDLHKLALRYQQLVEQATEVGSAFADQLSRVAVAAARSRGDTASLGQDFHFLTQCHKEISSQKAEQALKLGTQFVAPLGKRLKSDAKAHARMEDDFKSATKSLRSDIKKAGQQLAKAKKLAAKGSSTAAQSLEKATQLFEQRSNLYEEFNQRFLRTVLIEERRRYCYLIDNYASVFAPDFRTNEQQRVLTQILERCAEPEELPQESQELIDNNSSTTSRQPRAEEMGGADHGHNSEDASHLTRHDTQRYVPRGGVAIDMLRAHLGSTEY